MVPPSLEELWKRIIKDVASEGWITFVAERPTKKSIWQRIVEKLSRTRKRLDHP